MTDTDGVLNEFQGDLDISRLDPDNLPADPEALIKLLAGGKADEGGEDVKEGPEASAVPDPAEGGDEDEAPIASADGKHAIPYSVLKQEREARRAAVEQATALQAQLAALQESASGVAAPAEASGTAAVDDSDIEALEEEFPEFAKVNKATRAEFERFRQEIKSRDAKIEAMTAQWEREQMAKQQQVLDETQSAIDANPTLCFLQSEQADSALWQAAIDIDQALQARPAWANRPLAERFAKVVERLEEDYGPVKVPGRYQSDSRGAAKPSRAQAAAVQVDEDEDDPVFHTLSDLKGGSSPESSGVNAEAMTAEQIGAHFMRMDPAVLAKMDPAEILARM